MVQSCTYNNHLLLLQSRILFGQRDVIDGEATAKDVTKDKSFVPDTMDLVANNVKVKTEDATCR